MTEALADWVATAAQLPIAFAQVREDPHLDLWLLERIGRDELCGIMIASGGCTAAALTASGRVSHLHLVDINPAQLALSRLKLHLLQYDKPSERAQLLGYDALPADERRLHLEAKLQEKIGRASCRERV